MPEELIIEVFLWPDSTAWPLRAVQGYKCVLVNVQSHEGRGGEIHIRDLARSQSEI